MTAPNDTNTIDREAVAAKLDEARALIERGWTQGDFARDGEGNPARIDRYAACFCAVGALVAVDAEPEATPFLRDALGVCSISFWNDAPERTHAEVVEAFRRAAELARADQVRS